MSIFIGLVTIFLNFNVETSGMLKFEGVFIFRLPS